MQVMLMRLMSKGEYLIVPKGTKFTGSGKLGLKLRSTSENLLENIHSYGYLVYRICDYHKMSMNKALSSLQPG